MRHKDICPVCKRAYPYMPGTESKGLKIKCYKCGATLGLDDEVFYSYDKAIKTWNMMARKYVRDHKEE